MPSQITYTLKRPLYSPQRHIRKPILLTIVGHREAHAVQTRVVYDELAQRLRSEILLRLHLYRYYVRIVLHNEVNLQCRIVIAVIVDKGARQRLQLLQDIVLGESAFVLFKHIVADEYLLGRRLRQSTEQSAVEQKEFERRSRRNRE